MYSALKDTQNTSQASQGERCVKVLCDSQLSLPQLTQPVSIVMQ